MTKPSVTCLPVVPMDLLSFSVYLYLVGMEHCHSLSASRCLSLSVFTSVCTCLSVHLSLRGCHCVWLSLCLVLLSLFFPRA